MATVAEVCKARNLFGILLLVFLAGACGKSAEPPGANSKTLLARIEALEEELRNLKQGTGPQAPPQDVPKVPYGQWQDAQNREIGFWTREGEELCRVYAEESQRIMRRFYFEKDSFKDQVVLDIGCGPSGRLTWLDGSFLAIEPLAEDYRRLPWAQLEKYHKIYEQPAEIRIQELVGTLDMIFAINCLDHAFDVEQILANMFLYLKPGGRAFISVDLDKASGDLEHPLVLGHETMRSYLVKHGFTIEREEHGRCSPAQHCWGRGIAYHWWLQKPASENGNDSSGEPRQKGFKSAREFPRRQQL